MILGVGVILLLILWTSTAILWIFCSDSSVQHSKNRTIVTIFSIIVTFILMLLPTSKDGLSIITATEDIGRSYFVVINNQEIYNIEYCDYRLPELYIILFYLFLGV